MAKKAKKTAGDRRGKGKDYDDRSDIEKIHTQWHKLTGLHNRLEWSAAVIRAASACEIAANLAIRAEYADRSTFSTKYVDKLLYWANGLNNKMDKLLLPMLSAAEAVEFAGLKPLAKTVYEQRNKIAHSGIFLDEDESKAVIEAARQFIEKLVKIYDSSFKLKDRKGYGE
ncbi:hypothetical protein [Bradyrhizobium sp.]|uniref:hypothetical protein n=1 Tax=Bradyrhizobium sp. TaxID=376 RepID=UPI0027335896|nr:hypothetical protein [Bradyrhizobium sp.]MDP3074737.1 hypothetical protein [Bradyrhizobium sp.]